MNLIQTPTWVTDRTNKDSAEILVKYRSNFFFVKIKRIWNEFCLEIFEENTFRRELYKIFLTNFRSEDVTPVVWRPMALEADQLILTAAQYSTVQRSTVQSVYTSNWTCTPYTWYGKLPWEILIPTFWNLSDWQISADQELIQTDVSNISGLQIQISITNRSTVGLTEE